jgi:WD40 repeat protein
MSIRHIGAACAALLLVGSAALAQGSAVPPGDKTPLLRLEAGGPTAFVTALAFSPDGRDLYAAGWDKVVRVWRRNQAGQYRLEPRAYRVPIGPGLAGALNALALSPDGVWLAVGGRGVFRDAAGFRQAGLVLPSLGRVTPEMYEDEGLIYVFDTRNGSVRLLRGHRGFILSLAFAPARPNGAPLLVSAAQEWDADLKREVGRLRVWDVEKAAPAAVLADKLTLPFVARPSLAAWYPPGAPDALQVAFTWRDKHFRAWDVAGGILREVRDVQENPVVYLPDRDRALTAVFGADRVRLRTWRVAPGADPQPGPLEGLTSPDADRLPRALGLVSSGGTGRADLAAAVVKRMTPRGPEYSLQLLSLGNDFGALKAEALLWRGGDKQPALATALNGQYLAAAGSDDNNILIYRVRDLLAGDPTAQVRGSAGAVIHYAAFVRRNQDVGLLLNERGRKPVGSPPRAPVPTDLVFDFGNRSLTADLAGWKPEAPDLGDWRVEQEKERTFLDVYKGDRRVSRIPLPQRHELSDFALMPPVQQRPLLLALAAQQGGNPLLALYNASTGEQLRQYTGHAGPIHCLAFSADGRLLASCAEDETVCVWSLTDLDATRGRRGQLAGVAVMADPSGKLVVGRVADDSPARGRLQAGEAIDGLVEGDRLRPLTTPRAFYEALDRLRPGTTVTVRAGGRDVALPVGQGVDERKPLLSLFVTHAGRVEDRAWVGWSPIGPYEASDAGAERLIGWHFNTGEPGRPARFAAADQYRKTFYRPGVLNSLVAEGDAKNLPPPPRVKARMTLGVEEGGRFARADDHGESLVRRGRVRLRIRVTEAPVESLEAVTVRVDDGPEQPLDLAAAAGSLLTAPLDLGRGLHKVTVTARPRQAAPEDVTTEDVLVRYQPPAPRLVYGGKRQLVVQDEGFRLRAAVRAGLAGEGVRVRWSQAVNGKVVAEDTQDIDPDPDEDRAIEKAFRLLPGTNLLLVTAVNRNAPAGHRDPETDRLVVEVVLVRKATPPSITLDRIRPEGAAEGRSLAVEPGQTVRVGVGRVRLLGRIEAEEGLETAEWLRGDGGKPVALTGFQPGSKAVDVREDVSLEPGVQTIRLRARTARSDEADRAVTVEYQPPVPTAVITAPRDGQVEDGEGQTKETVLTARLLQPGEAHPYRTAVLLDGAEPTPPPAVEVDGRAGTLTARVLLHPGSNRLQVRCRNEWGAVFTSEPVRVRFLRLPRVVKLSAPDVSRRPAVSIEAQVRSPLPPLPETVKVEVNGKPRRVEATVADKRPAPGAWTVRVQDVPLDVGPSPSGEPESVLRFRVGNEEGECREPASVTVRYQPVKTPPQVDLLSPREDTVVSTPDVTVRFRVDSQSAIRAVRVERDGAEPVAVDVSGARADPQGFFELTGEAAVKLRAGPNTVRVVATNVGGDQGAAAVQVTSQYRPVRLVLDELVPADGGGQAVRPRDLAGGQVAFPPVRSARVRLRGRLVWDEAADPTLGESHAVRVFVNGFQQLPRALRAAPGAGRERRFEVDLLLTQEHGNQAELAVPGVALGEDARARFTVDCSRPERSQRLHLLLVSPRRQDGPALRAQFLKALGAVPGPEDQLRTAVFNPVTVYGPQVGFYARREYVNTRLLEIQSNISELAAAGVPSNDVVLVYYQGREAVRARGHFFEAVEVPDPDEDRVALSADDLAAFFADTPGAHLLFLDVNRAAEAGPDKVARWPAQYPGTARSVAVFRYAWLGPADAPRDVRLVQALEQALRGAAQLAGVKELLHEVAARSPEYNRQLRDSAYVAEELGKMDLAGR